MAGHRYWKLNVHSTGWTANGGILSIAELRGLETIGGPNVLVGGTASQTGTPFGGYVPSRAFDGDPNTEWINNPPFTDPVGLIYDLGAGVTKDIKEIYIVARNNGQPSQAPTSFDWQYSDDAITWTTYFSDTPPVQTVNGGTYPSGLFPSVPQIAEFVVIGVEGVAPANVQVGEFVVIGIYGGPPNSISLGPVYRLPCWQPCTAFGTEQLVVRLN